MFTLRGKIVYLGEQKSGISNRTGNPWTCRDAYVEYVSKEGVTSQMQFSIFNEEYSIGDEIEVDFIISLREYNGKKFNNVNVVEIRKIAMANTVAGNNAANVQQFTQAVRTPANYNQARTQAHTQQFQQPMQTETGLPY